MIYTTIRIDKDIKKVLDELKLHPRESYNEVIKRYFDNARALHSK